MAAHEPGISGEQRKTQEGDRDSILEFYRSMIPVQTVGTLEGLPGIRRHTSSGVQRTCNIIAYERRTEDTGYPVLLFNSAVQGRWRDCRESVQDAYGPNDREAMDGMMFNGETADKKTAGKETAGNRTGIEDGTLYLNHIRRCF